MAAVVLLVQHSLAPPLGHSARLILAVVAGSVSYLPAILLVDPALRREVQAIIRELLATPSARTAER
jgi:hypothetical protein